MGTALITIIITNKCRSKSSDTGSRLVSRTYIWTACLRSWPKDKYRTMKEWFNVYNGEMFQAAPRRNIARRFMRWWYNIDGKTSNTQCREVAKAVPVGTYKTKSSWYEKGFETVLFTYKTKLFLLFKHVWCVQLANGLCYKLRQLLHNDIRVRKRR